MHQVVNQTHEEKLKMYMKLSKKELAEMLIEANRYFDTPYIGIKDITTYNRNCPNGCKGNICFNAACPMRMDITCTT